MQFKDQVVWITGASSGLGWAMALEFARLGATLVLTARREKMLEQLVAHIEAAGGRAVAMACDVTDDASLRATADRIAAELGRLDVAVANAGFSVSGRFEDISAADWDRQMRLNVTALAMTARHALPQLRATAGRLVLIGSASAFVPVPRAAPYAASKAAVHSIGETLQIELSGSGVSCTTIHPGFVESNIARVDSAGVFHPDARDPRPARLMWPSDRAARVMVRAIRRRRKVFVFTGHGRLAYWVGRLVPPVARVAMRKVGVR
ncbi:SDR family NAD(P)-dependent oxidoreductase [Wenzhouxiangella limi]|uniref:SDR family NAD(P)-dependent oxidoreductase n=1 Tax=Wenzhouxiangella limi TaxID=2707351 RepID=A0A845VI34_9GAMM|nr:SDR family NAD(P)-dependent oxidoreductase [Wenzhouxiangella limi]NDY96839.1 SDR family NAD(P)-dependent oxidoreductase [Wenzhouxiangella limi]